MTLEQAIQELHQSRNSVEISWLWDGGIDVDAGREQHNFKRVSDVTPWLQHWYGLRGRPAESDALSEELQRIYDSEIHVTIRTGGKRIFVGLGTSFIGFERAGRVDQASAIVPWLQRAIHDKCPESQYDVERLAGMSPNRMNQGCTSSPTKKSISTPSADASPR